MSETIQELERKLAEAKRLESLHKDEKKKAEAESKVGKYFVYRYSSAGRKGKPVRCVGYFHAKSVDAFTLNDDTVMLKGKRVFVSIDESNEFAGTTLIAHESSEKASSLVEEIDKKTFKMALKLMKERAEVLLQDIQPIEVNDPAIIDLDIPYVIIPVHIRSILGDPDFVPFFSCGGRYLITPASLEYAKNKIEEKRNGLSRGSAYYQECDMRYVNRAYLDIEQLKTILKI